MTEVLLSRKEASAYLKQAYGAPGALAPSTLAKLVVIGGGPPFFRIGRRVGYRQADLDLWFKQKRRLGQGLSNIEQE